MIVIFVLTSLIIITSKILWTGIEGFLVPYKMQFGRGMDQLSFLMITYHALLGLIIEISIIGEETFNTIYNSYILKGHFCFSSR